MKLSGFKLKTALAGAGGNRPLFSIYYSLT
jgi:hypothetical protein